MSARFVVPICCIGLIQFLFDVLISVYLLCLLILTYNVNNIHMYTYMYVIHTHHHHRHHHAACRVLGLVTCVVPINCREAF